jgi:uncharacterized protein
MHQAPEVDWVAILIIAIWIAFVVYSIYQQQKQAGQYPQPAGRTGRGRSRRDRGIVILPGGSGSWGGSSGGGGGWSGGGGTFSGGGASGGW